MQYLAICEDDLLFQFMRNVATEQGDVRYLVPNAKIAQRIRRQRGKVWHGDLLKEETYKKTKLHHIDQAIVFVRDADYQHRVCRLLRVLDKNIPIVSLTSEKNGKKTAKEPDDPLLRHLQLADIFKDFAPRNCSTLSISRKSSASARYSTTARRFTYYCSMIPILTPSAALWRCALSPHRINSEVSRTPQIKSPTCPAINL